MEHKFNEHACSSLNVTIQKKKPFIKIILISQLNFPMTKQNKNKYLKFKVSISNLVF